MSNATYVPIDAPHLEIDRVLFPNGLGQCSRNERWVVANLINFLESNGWSVVSLDDGEETAQFQSIPGSANRMRAAMELVFNLEVCHLYFAQKDTLRHWVMLVLGNDMDVIADHTYSEQGSDDFEPLMTEFGQLVEQHGGHHGA